MSKKTIIRAAAVVMVVAGAVSVGFGVTHLNTGVVQQPRVYDWASSGVSTASSFETVSDADLESDTDSAVSQSSTGSGESSVSSVNETLPENSGSIDVVSDDAASENGVE